MADTGQGPSRCPRPPPGCPRRSRLPAAPPLPRPPGKRQGSPGPFRRLAPFPDDRWFLRGELPEHAEKPPTVLYPLDIPGDVLGIGVLHIEFEVITAFKDNAVPDTERAACLKTIRVR